MLTVHFTAADVAARPAAMEGESHVALTPSASFAARAAGLAVHDSTVFFSDTDHARCVVAGRRAVKDVDAFLEHRDISSAVAVLVRQSAWNVAVMAHRVARTIRNPNARLRNASGTWQRASDVESVLDALFPRIIDAGLGHKFESNPPSSPTLHWMLLRMAALSARLRAGPKVLVAPSDLKMGAARALREVGVEAIKVKPTRGTKADVSSMLALMLGKGRELSLAPVLVTDAEFVQVDTSLAALSRRFTSPITRRAWQIYTPRLLENIRGMLGMIRGSARFLAESGIGSVATYEANGWGGASLFEAGRRSGVRRIAFNHNCHASTGGALSDDVIGFLYEQRKHTPDVTASVVWSPSDQSFASRKRRIALKKVRASYPNVVGTVKRPGDRFSILHAGNYQNWSDFFPWVAETSFEFVESLRLLAEAVSTLPEIELTVRIRPKLEVDENVVKRALPKADNISVCSVEEDFTEQLAGADLLTSFFSTTVEQSVQLGKPVLLWGRTRRLLQLPACTLPPTAKERSVIYAVHDAEHLPAMLKALAIAHREPLSAAEVESYRLPSDASDLREFAMEWRTKGGLC